MLKVKRKNIVHLEDLPNIGKAIASDLRLIGIYAPEELKGKDPFDMFKKLNDQTGEKHDPCLLDVFISVVRYMEGAPPHPWWYYTPERKKALLI